MLFLSERPNHVIKISLLALCFVLLTGFTAQATTYYSNYGQNRTWNITTSAGTHTFVVNGIFLVDRHTEWYVNGVYKETDDTNVWNLYADPLYSRYFSSGTTEIKALVYDWNWNYLEYHKWNVTIKHILTVYSNVSSASVYLDNSYKGTTSGLWAPYSLAISGVSSGSHTVKVSKSGWETKQQSVSVYSDTSTTVNLRRNTSITITLVPKQASSLRLPRGGADDFTGT